MTAETEIPSLQVVEKLKSIPVVGLAYNVSSDIYNGVKGASPLINWAFKSAESVVGTAVGTVAPIAAKLQQPINNVDAKLCYGLDILQDKVPIVKDQPSEIYGKGKNYISTNINCAVQETVKLRDKSWNKANEILKSPYGNLALTGLDSTSTIADKFIDYYLPPDEGEEEIHPHPNADCEDKVLHAAHTVGALSNKMGHRVYRNLSKRLNNKPQLQGPANTSQSASG